MKFPKTLVLDTERCRLRFISKADIPHVFSATRYQGFNDGMLWEPPKTEQELIEPFNRNVKAWEEDKAFTFTIESKQGNEFIGRITTRLQAEEGVWDIGFWTHPMHQGRGYMTEATREIIDFCFLNLDTKKIVACHALWNKSSERVLQKCGLKLAGYNPQGFQKKGVWIEENLLELCRKDWTLNRPNNEELP